MKEKSEVIPTANSQSTPLLGILGGLGPMATVYFYEMLTAHTKALCDQDHIDVLISGRATTPDRTAYILGQSTANPLPVMAEETRRLVAAGASLLVLPCNTAHYFYDELAKITDVPFLNIIEETVRHCASRGWKKLGILATEGTIRSGAYHGVCERYGVEAVAPSQEQQAVINRIIYGEIKRGAEPDLTAFLAVADAMRAKGCDTLILGCTELSLLKKGGRLSSYYTDSLEVLAAATIRACGKTPFGFDFL